MTHTAEPQASTLTLSARLYRRWLLMLRGILHLWVRSKPLPDQDGGIGTDHDVPVCYVMDDYALSSVLILDRVCQAQGLARPLNPLQGLERESRAYAVMRRLKGLILRRPLVRRSSQLLKVLVDHVHEHPEMDIALVPVTVFVGRAPDKSSGLGKVLFAENWQVAGRFRRLFSTLFNGRDTLVQFSRPISIRELAAEGLGSDRSLRKVSRILRTHFRRVRINAIGPDLSHRRMLIDQLMNTQALRNAIAEESRQKNISTEKAEKLARKHAHEIAADYSYTFIRVAFMTIRWFTNKVLSGIDLHHFERFKANAQDHEIIYVPCHRSHMDYLLVSFLLHQNGFVPPHIAAGLNLNLPMIGPLLRTGGAFYLRRTFKSQKLYAAVFNEYLSAILSQGVSIEYFIEGTRSRTGRLLQPKAGMLAMTVKGYLHAPTRPVMFQPVYLGYEQVLEGAAYTKELSGSDKKTEKLSDFFKVMKILGKDHGRAAVSFGEPVFLDQLLDECSVDWREFTGTDASKPPWLTAMIEDLGKRIMTNINRCADVNPVNLLAMILLGTSRLALGEKELARQIDLYRELLRNGGFGEQITVTDKSGDEVIEYGLERGLLDRIEDSLGDMIALKQELAVEMTYARNNITHLLVAPSLIAGCFTNQPEVEVSRLKFIAHAIYPFLRAELFLPWDRRAFLAEVDSNIELLKHQGLLVDAPRDGVLACAPGPSDKAGQLALLAPALLHTLERHFIAIAILAQHGSGVLSRGELEKLCIQTAQRISRLHGLEAPEFYDRNLFRQFITQLRKYKVITNNDDGLLLYDERVDEISLHARYVLRKEIRQEIVRFASETTSAAPTEAKITHQDQE